MELSYQDFPEAYQDMLWKFRISGELENTRNGVALVMQEPVLVHISKPRCKVIADAVRNANPFFHVMETVWMLAGKHDPRWLKPFNKRIMDYADEGQLGQPVINGAYGYRWFRHFGDQVARVIGMLSADVNTRQAVIAMWDPTMDLQPHWKDRPCNTHLYFRARNDALEMTVCNRSNDFIWGMMGANAVHLTYLHELIARAVNLGHGRYSVLTNNLHFYLKQYPNGEEILAAPDVLDSVYPRATYPILHEDETWQRLVLECKLFIDGKFDQLTCKWLKNVALPMRNIYLKEEPQVEIAADDWKEACKRWIKRNRV